MPPNADFMPLFSAHEDRLQRLEVDRTKLAAMEVTQGRTEQRLAAVEKKIEENVEATNEIRKILIEMSTSLRFYSEKLEDLGAQMSKSHESLEEALESVVAENKTQGDDIKSMKKAEAQAEKVFDWKMKFLFGTGAATGGAILSMLVEYFKKKFGG
jgi:septal ring factor EnvC (AmiA/AmiB activator)